MKNKMLLIKFDSNYADEFDLKGFTVMTETDWEKHKAGVKKMFDALPEPTADKSGYVSHPEIEKYFGTNEMLSWTSFDSYVYSFKVTEITDEEHATLKKFFSKFDRQINYGSIVMLEPEYEDEDDDSSDEE